MMQLDVFSLEIDGFRMQRDAGKWFLRSQVRTRTVRAAFGRRPRQGTVEWKPENAEGTV